MAWASCGTAPFHVGRRVLAAVVHAGRQPVRGFPGPRSEMHPRASADSRSNSCFAAIRSHVRQGPVPNGTVSYQPSLAMTFRVMAALGAATHVFGGESSKDVGDRAKPAKPPAKPGHETEADRLADMGQHQRRFVSQETKRDGRETDCGRVSFVAAESRVIPNETAVRHQDFLSPPWPPAAALPRQAPSIERRGGRPWRLGRVRRRCVQNSRTRSPCTRKPRGRPGRSGCGCRQGTRNFRTRSPCTRRLRSRARQPGRAARRREPISGLGWPVRVPATTHSPCAHRDGNAHTPAAPSHG